MIRRALGRTGLSVSPLGLGTVKFGRNESVKYPEPFGLPSDRDLARLLARAGSLGIDVLDTAPAYGESEARIGRLLKGRRHEWTLCTKVGEEFENGVSRFDFSAEHVRFSVERSLTRLATDRLDLVLVHSDGNDLAILRAGEALGTLGDLKREGSIRAFGFSHKTLEGGLLAVEHCDVVMTTFNLEDASMLPVIRAAAARECGVMIKKVFASGHAATAEARRRSLAVAAAEPGVSCIVIGTVDAGHLADNVAVFSSIRV